MGEAGEEMIKSDEILFMRDILNMGGRVDPLIWGDLTKRQYGLLAKWVSKGWWEFGVSTRGGWLTEVGRKKFDATIATQTASKGNGATSRSAPLT